MSQNRLVLVLVLVLVTEVGKATEMEEEGVVLKELVVKEVGMVEVMSLVV